MDAIDGKAKWWNCYYIQAQPGFQRGGGECVRASEGGSRPPTKPFIFSPKMPTEQNKRVGKATLRHLARAWPFFHNGQQVNKVGG